MKEIKIPQHYQPKQKVRDWEKFLIEGKIGYIETTDLTPEPDLRNVYFDERDGLIKRINK